MKIKRIDAIKTNQEVNFVENKEDDVTFYFDKASTLNVFDDGKITTFKKGDEKYQTIVSAMLEMTKNSRPMPAFSVSLDNETREDMKKGFWVELEFETTQTALEMHFDALLVKIERQYNGINIIRKLNGKYEGRCFYLDLEKDMDKLFAAVQNISKNQ